MTYLCVRAAAGRAPPSTPCGARPARRAVRGAGWTGDAVYLRGAHLTARPRGRAARAEPLSFAHGSLTH